MKATLRYLQRQKFTGKIAVEICMNQGGISVAYTYRKDKLVVPVEELILATG